MCGIIGQVDGPQNKTVFEGACSILFHRGPDDSGVYYERGIALGHRRLSIIDTSSGGHQPMQSSDGRYTITFNGELFNYIELREELQSRYPFSTKSDTEVLVAAYAVWGTAMFPKLIGQFSFAIWDKEEQLLLVARDHFGIKPLFYHFANGVFSFASEIKALHALGVAVYANDKVIFDYLAFEIYDHTSETFFDGVHSLPKGSYARVQHGAMSIQPYWKIKDAVEAETIPNTPAEVEEKFVDLLNSSIKLQLISDVPVGINLSSGLDSSIVFELSRNSLSRPAHAFSACLEDHIYDEGQYIRPWVETMDDLVWHTGTLKRSNFWPLVEELIGLSDQPFGGMPTVQYYNLYKETAPVPITVLLEGQGMDELLAGYDYFAPGARDNFLAQFKKPSIKPAYLSESFVRRFDGAGTHYVLPFEDSLRNAQYVDLYYRKLPRPLRFNDHISMRFSRELRVPFLDHRLAAFCLALPEEYKISNGVHKYLLRKMAGSRMPHAMRSKYHVDFSAFQTLWFRRYFRDEINRIVQSPSFKGRPYWDHGRVEQVVNEFFAGKGANSFFLWQLINLELWLRRFID
jgi:asparagine synthase (glutamine-hydrolysing)